MGTEGDHEKWKTPKGLTIPIVAGEKEQTSGTLRNLQLALASEFGEKWLEKELNR